ncbi:peptidase, M50 family protein [Calothrix sp. NIES-4071]|nr:peptidase, M50 family protein [Calothrix sp. NIES-4071]BAZ54703.1 peptidase, M50 family protein [Calothrix sp. NIES-4105]
MWLVAVLVCFGWMMSLCLHEFGHAITAYWGGDTSVKDKGYLTLNPFKYTDPGISLLAPLLFLMLGGFALPGGAVYIDTSKLRSRFWNSAVSAAGCIAEFILILVLTGVFQATWNQGTSDNQLYLHLMSSLAYVIFLNIYVIFLNLLPFPGLDGYGIIQPWIPQSINQRLTKFSSYGFWILIALLWFYPPFGLGLRSLSDGVIELLQIPSSLVDTGATLFRSRAQYIVLGLVAVLWVFRDKRKDLYRNGTRLVSEGKYERAIATFDKAIEKEPGYYRAWLMRGYSLYCLKRYDEALINYDKALAIKPDSDDVWFYKGVVFGDIGKEGEELSCYNRVLELQPEYVEALCNRGDIYLKEGNYELALADFNAASSLNTDYAQAWYKKGDVLSKLGHDEEAIAAYQQVMRLQPRSDVWVNLVKLLEKAKQYDSILAIYNQKLRLQPEDATVFNRRGLILEELGQQDEAKSSFTQALKISEKISKRYPKDAGAFFDKGLAYQCLHNYVDAISAYKQTIEIEDTHSYAWYNLACCYARQNNLELTVEHLRVSINLDETHLIRAKTDPDFDTIRCDELFQSLFRKD